MPSPFRAWIIAALFLGLLALGRTGPCFALTGSVETGLGYDSNPTLAYSGEKDSGFTSISAELTQGLTPSSHTLFTIGAHGMGRHYFRGGEDETFVGVHSDITYISPEGTFQPTIFSRVAFYRSDLVPEDDRDVAGLGASLEYYPGIGIGISLGISFDWLDFRRPYTILGSRVIQGGSHGMGGQVLGALGSIPGLKSSYGTRRPQPQGEGWMGKPPATPMDPMVAMGHMPSLNKLYTPADPRDDRYESTYFSIQKDLLQYVTSSLTLTRERLYSSVKYESFTRYGAVGDMSISLPGNLDLIATFAWKRAIFRETSMGHRTDYLKYVSIELIKSYKNFGVSVGYEHMTNDSSIEFEDFRKNLLRIKLGFYF